MSRVRAVFSRQMRLKIVTCRPSPWFGDVTKPHGSHCACWQERQVSRIQLQAQISHSTPAEISLTYKISQRLACVSLLVTVKVCLSCLVGRQLRTSASKLCLSSFLLHPHPVAIVTRLVDAVRSCLSAVPCLRSPLCQLLVHVAARTNCTRPVSRRASKESRIFRSTNDKPAVRARLFSLTPRTFLSLATNFLRRQ
jgi:hypothetical protein